MKRIGVLLYDNFSLQEITTLTSCLTVWFGEKLEYLAAEDRPYLSEEGFRVLPGKTLDRACAGDYDCLILPGTIDPMPTLYDRRVIGFLEGARGTGKLLAAISSAPIFLAKAGLLEGTDFTAGFFMQMAETYPFVDLAHFRHRPVVEDGQVITAIGFAFREFAQAVLKRLDLDPGEDFMGPVDRDYTEEELTFYWEEADYREFLEELKQYEG